MDGAPPPEIREINGRSRTWGFGSQHLGHYETRNSRNQNRVPSSNYHEPTSPSSAIIDIHNGTAQYPQVRGVSSSNFLFPNPMHGSPMNQSPSTLSPSLDALSFDGRNEYKDPDNIRPLIRASTTFYDRIITDWWWWELLSCFVSLASVAAIVGMLLFYSGKKQPDRIFLGITLNAYISVFSAVAKAALILPVSEAIGQLKWMLFRNESRLWDFFVYDGASRGPWGSLILLGSTKCRHLASVGAIITVLALAFEPFFQQIVSFPPRDVATGIGTLPIARRWRPENAFGFNVAVPDGNSPYGLSMTTAINDAMFTMNFTPKAVPSRCPTGRCAWKSYSSLGVCHKCENLTSKGLLQPFCKNNTSLGRPQTGVGAREPCGYTINGLWVAGTEDRGKGDTILTNIVVGELVFTGPQRWNSTTFPDVPYPIIDFYSGYIAGGSSQAHNKSAMPTLMECMLQWCVRTYEATYSDGLLNERLLRTVAVHSIDSSNNGTGDDLFTINVDGNSFGVIQNTTGFLARSLQADLPLFISSFQLDSSGHTLGMWNFFQEPPYDINPYLENVATAMTNAIRSREDGNNTEVIEGLAWAQENFVEIRWVWITLPAALLIGSLIFVAATILTSRKDGTAAWKSSALATLLHGLSKEARAQFDPHSSPSEVEALSRKLHVKLSRDDDGNTKLGLV